MMARKPVAPEQAPRVDRIVAAYVRVSTDEQAKSGLGLGDQRHRTFAMATVKGWPEPLVYADEGVSGTLGPSKKRPGLLRLMEDIQAGKIDAVIILSLDRLGRKTSLVLQLVEQMTAAGVALVSCKESLDTTTPQGQFVLTLFAALSQLERDMIAERTKGALAQLAREGRDKGGRLPYGYLRTKQGIQVQAEHAAVVRAIFRARRQGHALRVIAGALNAQGVAAPHGKQWYAPSVREVLLNVKAYRGGGSRGQEHLVWPAILTAPANKQKGA